MKQLVVGIFRERRDIEEFEFKAPQYQQAYHEIIDLLNERDVYVAVLMGQGTYQGKGTFSQHWVQINDNGVYRFEKQGAITVDMVLDKDHLKDDGKVVKVNEDALYQICWNKEKTYEVLGEFHPKSVVVESEAGLEAALKTLPGDKVAIKAFTGSSGKGVFVGSKEDAAAEEEILEFPVLVQEFIETSGGIPGITNKRHDVRVVLMDGEPIIATLRTPPANGLKSNIGYGGENRLLDIKDLPAELLALCAEIDIRLQPYSKFRLYSLDCGLTQHGWKLFEANAMPGVINRARGPQAWFYQEKLADFLKKVAQAGRQKE